MIYLTNSVEEPEPGHFGRSWSRRKGPAQAPGSYSNLDKTKEILNDILFVRFYQCFCTGPILTSSEFFFAGSGSNPGSSLNNKKALNHLIIFY